MQSLLHVTFVSPLPHVALLKIELLLLQRSKPFSVQFFHLQDKAVVIQVVTIDAPYTAAAKVVTAARADRLLEPRKHLRFRPLISPPSFPKTSSILREARDMTHAVLQCLLPRARESWGDKRRELRQSSLAKISSSKQECMSTTLPPPSKVVATTP